MPIPEVDRHLHIAQMSLGRAINLSLKALTLAVMEDYSEPEVQRVLGDSDTCMANADGNLDLAFKLDDDAQADARLIHTRAGREGRRRRNRKRTSS